MTQSFCDLTVIYGVSMITYTISVSTHSTLLRYSVVLSEYLSNHSTCPDTRPDTINTRPRSVKLETYRPGNEARQNPEKVLINVSFVLGTNV